MENVREVTRNLVFYIEGYLAFETKICFSMLVFINLAYIYFERERERERDGFSL